MQIASIDGIPLSQLENLEVSINWNILGQQLVDQLLPDYKKNISKYNPVLEAYGAWAVKHAFASAEKSVLSLIKKTTVETITDPPPPPPTWVTKLTDPVLEPVLRGVKQEAVKQIIPWAIGGSVIVLMLLGGSFWLGRWSRR